MGNYQEYLKRMPNPLRELESAPVRQHMFGNPFKIDKRMIIDEADIDLLGQGKSTKKENAAAAAANTQINQIPVTPLPIPRGQKRKVGPLPKDFKFTSYKNRRTHTRTHTRIVESGMGEQQQQKHIREEDSSSDTDSNYNSSQSSPMNMMMMMTPPDSPVSLNYFSNDKENSLGMNSLDTFNTNTSRDRDNDNLIIDESPSSNSDSMTFGSSMFNSIDEINDDVDVEEDRDNENNEMADERYPPYEMNGTINDNDFKVNNNTSNNNNNNNSSSNTSSTPHHKPPPENGVIISASISNKSVSKVESNHINHFPPPPPLNNNANSNTNHVVGNKNKKVKASNIVKSKTSNSSRQYSNEVDDDSTYKKNLDLRIQLFKEIRRPVLTFRSGLYFIPIVKCCRIIYY
jgi:hypothetical protein